MIDVLKLCNYLAEGRHLFAVEATFATLCDVGVRAALPAGARRLARRDRRAARGRDRARLARGRRCRVRRRRRARLGHAPGYRVPRDIGQGKFDALANIMAVPMHDVLLGPQLLFVALLCAVLMNLAWYAMFWRMLTGSRDTPGERRRGVRGDGARDRKRR